MRIRSRHAGLALLVLISLTTLTRFQAMAAQATAKAVTRVAPAQVDFPEGTATASDVCGACHQAIYREYSTGFGSDLHWNGMKGFTGSLKPLLLPDGSSRSATAHSLAGVDPFPLEAIDVQENGKHCITCHYPEPLRYPLMSAARIERPKPRSPNQEAGITCASCHLTPEGAIRGPYDVKAPHATVKDETIKTSVACALCHSDGQRVVGKQTQTFLEWREDFNKAGLGPQQCQDCHMPRTLRKLAEGFDGPERPSARHLWTGGHSYQRLGGALSLAVVQPEEGKAAIAFHLTNTGAGHSVPTGSNRRAVYLHADVINAGNQIVATREWMFAPSFGDRPDDQTFVKVDANGPEPIASAMADTQGPHETIIRAGEERVLQWAAPLRAGSYTVRATLIYDLNRYNARSFKDDQHEIGRADLAIKVAAGPPGPH